MRPQRADIPGNVKVTRDDWLDAARAALVAHGVGEVKILALAEALGVSRSSFYWYFGSREDLLAALLADWEARNTRVLIEHAGRDTPTITAAVLELFHAFIAPDLFDYRLDFAIREWARRDAAVRAALDRGDEARREAIAAMFRRHGYETAEADIRARILYYMQIGYYTLDLAEDIETRLSRVEGYLEGFTGRSPAPGEVAAFGERIRAA